MEEKKPLQWQVLDVNEEIACKKLTAPNVMELRNIGKILCKSECKWENQM